MSEFTPIETQDDFDKAIKSRLAQKDRELADKYKDYLSPEKAEAMKADFEKKLEETNKTVKEAQEKLSSYDQTVSELTQRAEMAEATLLKNTVAYEHKIPLELAGRLIGSTKEELDKDAETISGLLKPQGTGSIPPLHTGTQTTNTNNGLDAGMAQLLAGVNASMAG